MKNRKSNGKINKKDKIFFSDQRKMVFMSPILQIVFCSFYFFKYFVEQSIQNINHHTFIPCVHVKCNIFTQKCGNSGLLVFFYTKAFSS